MFVFEITDNSFCVLIDYLYIDNSDSNKNNSDSNYNLLPNSSSEKSSENQMNKEISEKSKSNYDDIIIRNSILESNDINENQNEINLIVKKPPKKK